MRNRTEREMRTVTLPANEIFHTLSNGCISMVTGDSKRMGTFVGLNSTRAAILLSISLRCSGVQPTPFLGPALAADRNSSLARFRFSSDELSSAETGIPTPARFELLGILEHFDCEIYRTSKRENGWTTLDGLNGTAWSTRIMNENIKIWLWNTISDSDTEAGHGPMRGPGTGP
jgi:hypothetical protein